MLTFIKIEMSNPDAVLYVSDIAEISGYLGGFEKFALQISHRFFVQDKNMGYKEL